MAAERLAPRQAATACINQTIKSIDLKQLLKYIISISQLNQPGTLAIILNKESP